MLHVLNPLKQFKGWDALHLSFMMTSPFFPSTNNIIAAKYWQGSIQDSAKCRLQQHTTTASFTAISLSKQQYTNFFYLCQCP